MSGRAIACPSCGAVQHLPLLASGEAARCVRCDSILERSRGTSVGGAAALAIATFVLLIPANLLPLYRVELLAGSRASHVTSGVHAFWAQHWPLPAIAMLVFVLILPLLRFALLGLVLGAVHLGRASPRLGPSFRVAQTLGVWAMPEVMLLGIYVAYGRLTALFDLKVGEGALFMAAATVGALLTRAAIDEATVWRAIMPEPAVPAGPTLSCQACLLVLPLAASGGDCPRCNARLEPRKTNSLALTTALIGTGLVLYLPANLLPMALTIKLATASSYTVFGGVIELADAGLWGLAALVFTASFAIPLLKLTGMVWLLWSVHTGSTRALKLKTRLHHAIHEIGRWSMVDVLAIGTFVPLMQFDQLANAQAMPGMVAFLGVVIATMFSTHSFDTRLLWDALDRRSSTMRPLPA
ncbi:paraquat-inducible protein A [Sphingomonas bacterium]|uniref:paraquat-inducible protein A n=1 Tax=Sphingomonas bacterium TaxID=1895847 RepID=UPI001576F976|nr:paraquat-inducible protein A [Sphingomonas bacterium]